LNGIQEHEPGFRGQLEVVEGSVGNLGDRQDALRRLGLGGARELERAHLGDVDAPLLEDAEQRGPARRVRQLRGDEGTSEREAGSDQFFDGADAFGREQLLALARFPTPEVTS
jgi:hypothetical protein